MYTYMYIYTHIQALYILIDIFEFQIITLN